MNTIWIVLPILIVLMFQLGIELDRQAFAGVFRRPAAVVAGLLGQLLALPLIAFGVALAFRLPPVWFMGLMLIACCPGGSSSNVFSMLAKGDVALSVTLTALSSVVTLFTIPVVMGFAARFVSVHADAAIDLPAGKLLVQNIVLLFLPMAAGALFRRWRPDTARRVHASLGRVAFPALMLLAAVFFVQYAGTILENLGTLGLAAGALILLAMSAGSLLSRVFGLRRAARRTVVIEVGMQNAAQAIAIAASPLIFDSGEMAIPAIVYALLMNVILLVYLKLLPKYSGETAARISSDRLYLPYETPENRDAVSVPAGGVRRAGTAGNLLRQRTGDRPSEPPPRGLCCRGAGRAGAEGRFDRFAGEIPHRTGGARHLAAGGLVGGV